MQKDTLDSNQCKKRCAYVAGPMSNRYGFNFHMFDRCKIDLEEKGWTVISPADLDRAIGFDPYRDKATPEFLHDAMIRDTDAIIHKADAMVMLPDWEQSTGAKAEYHLARWKHIPVFQWPEMTEILSEKSVKTSDKTESASGLPKSAAERKRVPIFSGVLKYFPRAIAAVAHCSWVGNEQHNPGEPLHWSREKSSDHHDCLVRHLMESGTVDSDGVRHSAKLAWRSLALLELEIEREAK